MINRVSLKTIFVFVPFDAELDVVALTHHARRELIVGIHFGAVEEDAVELVAFRIINVVPAQRTYTNHERGAQQSRTRTP